MKDRLRYWWAWNKLDVIHHAVTVAAIVAALLIGGCVVDSLPNANVDLPDTAAQDSASKSNNPAVSG